MTFWEAVWRMPGKLLSAWLHSDLVDELQGKLDVDFRVIRELQAKVSRYKTLNYNLERQIKALTADNGIQYMKGIESMSDRLQAAIDHASRESRRAQLMTLERDQARHKYEALAAQYNRVVIALNAKAADQEAIEDMDEETLADQYHKMCEVLKDES